VIAFMAATLLYWDRNRVVAVLASVIAAALATIGVLLAIVMLRRGGDRN